MANSNGIAVLLENGCRGSGNIHTHLRFKRETNIRFGQSLPRRPLQPVQIVGCGLAFGGRGDDGPLVVLQRLEPAFQVGCGIISRIVGHSEISAEECSGELGNQLLDGVAFTAEAAAQIAIKAMLCA